jgi:DNA-binding cell septation regulator SpoVG
MKVTNVWIHKYTSGKMLGFADVKLSLDNSDNGHMTWKGLKLFQGRDGGVQIGLPSKKDEKGKVDEDGKIIYHPVITVDRAEDNNGIGDEFLEHLRGEIELEYVKLASGQSQPPANSGESKDVSGPIDGADLPF